MGFSREALLAGAQPKRMPTEAEKVNASAMAPVDMLKVNPMATAMMQDSTFPSSMPARPPIRLSITDSIRNWA